MMCTSHICAEPAFTGCNFHAVELVVTVGVWMRLVLGDAVMSQKARDGRSLHRECQCASDVVDGCGVIFLLCC